jgi:hypothetical protein
MLPSKLTFTIFLFFMCNLAFAQESTTAYVPGQNSFFAELGGPGILFSANFDRRFTKSNLGIGGRIGFGFVTEDFGEFYNEGPKSVLSVPVQLNYVFGKPNSVHSFEVGAGATFTGKKIDIFTYQGTEGQSAFATASFMYRRQPAEGGFSWRIGFTPIFGGGYVQPSGGVSVGYNF